MSETQTNLTIDEIKSMSLEITNLLKHLTEKLKEFNIEKEIIYKRLYELEKGWRCIYDITLDFYRRECRVTGVLDSGKMTLYIETPQNLVIEVYGSNSMNYNELRNVILQELQKNFVNQVRRTADKLIEIMVNVRDVLEKYIAYRIDVVENKINELQEKVKSMG